MDRFINPGSTIYLVGWLQSQGTSNSTEALVEGVAILLSARLERGHGTTTLWRSVPVSENEHAFALWLLVGILCEFMDKKKNCVMEHSSIAKSAFCPSPRTTLQLPSHYRSGLV